MADGLALAEVIDRHPQVPAGFAVHAVVDGELVSHIQSVG